MIAEAVPEILDFPSWMVWLIQLAFTCLITFAFVCLICLLGVALHVLFNAEDRQNIRASRSTRNTFFDQDQH